MGKQNDLSISDVFPPIIGIAGYRGYAPSRRIKFYDSLMWHLNYQKFPLYWYEIADPIKWDLSKDFLCERSCLNDAKIFRSQETGEFLRKSFVEYFENAVLTGRLIKRMRTKIYSEKRLIVFPDVRREDEAMIIRDCGGIIIHINFGGMKSDLSRLIDVCVREDDFAYNTMGEIDSVAANMLINYVVNGLKEIGIKAKRKSLVEVYNNISGAMKTKVN